jgi:two-component system sensor histidine kinase PilS (NtrC family)
MVHSTPFTYLDKTASRFLHWYLAVRILVIILFLGGAILNQMRSGVANAPVLWWLYLLAALYILQSLSFLPLFGRSRQQVVLLRWQTCWDLVFATGLVFLTGGVVSHFSFLYICIIFAVSIFLSRREVFVAASAAAILYGGLLDLQYYAVLPVLSVFSSSPVSSREIFYAIFINVIAFYLIAFLSSLLAERLRHSELALKKRQIDFEELENLNRIILSNIPSGLIIVNNSGRIRSFNAGAAAITGYALEEVYNRPVGQLFPDMAVLEGGEFKTVARGETQLTDKQGGRRPVGFTSSLVRDVSAETLGLLITFQDLSHLKAMEGQLKRADRLAAVGQLAAGMAHEIRNPLASISGSVQLLMEGEKLEPEDRRLMGIVVREAERLNALLTDFLVYARPAPPELVAVDIAELLDELMDIVTADRRFQDVQFRKAYTGPIDWRCDRAQIRQVLWNLLVNGAEAMEYAGRLTLGYDAEGETVYIEDTGPGIPAELRAKIFDPFFTTKDSGTGLGLATVHAIVEAHQGRLELVKAEGGGERFIICMPDPSLQKFERAK